jgi:hypothetical protein
LKGYAIQLADGGRDLFTKGDDRIFLPDLANLRDLPASCRGEARMIHVPLVSRGKVYLLDMFEKNDKVIVTKAERNEMAKIVKSMKGRGT